MQRNQAEAQKLYKKTRPEPRMVLGCRLSLHLRIFCYLTSVFLQRSKRRFSNRRLAFPQQCRFNNAQSAITFKRFCLESRSEAEQGERLGNSVETHVDGPPKPQRNLFCNL
jgi:hypothetical protein